MYIETIKVKVTWNDGTIEDFFPTRIEFNDGIIELSYYDENHEENGWTKIISLRFARKVEY